MAGKSEVGKVKISLRQMLGPKGAPVLNLLQYTLGEEIARENGCCD